MEIRVASLAAPSRVVNEDHAVVSDNLIGVFDGVTEPPGQDTGCIHGTAWFVRHLGAQVIRAHTDAPNEDLRKILADAVIATRADHHGACRLDLPTTPAATVCLLRQHAGNVDYLVLCDTTLVLDHGDRVEVLTDPRFRDTITRLRGTPTETSRGTALPRQITLAKYAHINQDSGYWVAGSDPAAAYQAVTGSATLRGLDAVRRAALLTDGASCAVDMFALMDWRGLLDLLTQHGPAELIARIRGVEAAGGDATRYKQHDDATAAICLFTEEPT